MNKQIYILNSPSGSAGVARISKRNGRYVLSIFLKHNIPGRKTCHIINNETNINIGSFYKNKTDFEIPSGLTVEKIYIEENDNIVAWSGETPSNIENEKGEITSEETTFENFFGGGFEWHRIRGNFIMFDYSIIHHVLANKNVYHAINQAGYYCAGIKVDNDITYVSVAIPLINGISTPFADIPAESFRINSNKKIFDALCTGIDRSGEFFINK